VGLLDRTRGDVLQRESAQRKRLAVTEAVTAQVGEFERAAAQVTDYAVRPMDAGNDAERRKLSLAFAGNHLDVARADSFGMADELGAVLGFATGGGRNGQALRYFDAVAQNPEAPKRGKRLLHRVGCQEAGRMHGAA